MNICPSCNLEVETDDDNFYEVAVEGEKYIAHSECYFAHSLTDWETHQDNEAKVDAVDWLQEQLEDMMLDAQDVLERFLAAGFISNEQVRSIYGSHIRAWESEDK